MSRLNDGTPVPMTNTRRDDIMSNLCDAIQGACAPFNGESFVVTCVRHDGRLAELVGTIAHEKNATWVHHGYAPHPSEAKRGDEQGGGE